MKTLSLLFVFILSFQLAHAEEPTPLDPPYQNLVPPQKSVEGAVSDFTSFFKIPKTSVEQIISFQTPVKSQAERGTCSIFSATALLENKLILKSIALGQTTDVPDLSEEYLQYLISQSTSTGGSYSLKNFQALTNEGQPYEATFPYSEKDWANLSNIDAKARCGHLALDAWNLGSCLMSHRDPALMKQTFEILNKTGSPYYDPQFYLAREQARANKALFFGPKASSSYVWTTWQIKRALDKGQALTMDIAFYYGAWNHRKTEELGIHRDMNLWEHGVITYPEDGSLDRIKSLESPAGHSVVIVGYDNDREVEYSLTMQDGSMKTFKRKGVYYFKNSWGTSNFGVLTTINNQIYPGYGMITQDYANSYGSFYSLDID